MQEQTKNTLCLNDEGEDLFGVPEKYDYSKFQNLDGFNLDDELMRQFIPIAKKLKLSQRSVEMLFEIALNMAKKQNLQYEQDSLIKEQNKLEGYYKKFCEDCELPNPNSPRISEFMRVADGAYNEFASAELKEAFRETGLNYHPELIKMFYKIGELAQEDNLSHYGKPAFEELTPAQILYGKND